MITQVEEKLIDMGVEYQHSGGDFVVKCLNPLHDDSSPSMRIDKISSVYHCFSCGHKGLLVAGTSTGAHKLAQNVLVMKKKIELLRLAKLALPKDAIPFNVDFRGLKAATFAHFGAFTSNTGSFKGRIVFPITDVNNNIKAFIGRANEPDVSPRYDIVGTPTTFPAVIDNPEQRVILVEGIFDMLNLHDKGYTNAVCVFGTSFCRRKDLIDLLGKYKLQGITGFTILMDGDKAGQEAAEVLQERLEKHFITNTVTLSTGEDPGELSLKRMKEILT